MLTSFYLYVKVYFLMVTIWLYIISYVEYSNINCSSKWKIPDLFSGLREPDYQMFMTTCCRFQLCSLYSSSLGSDESPVPILASCKSPWTALRRSVKGLSVEFSVLSEKAAQQVLCRPHKPHELLPQRNSIHLFNTGQKRGGWCGGKTESVPGLAAVVQGEYLCALTFSQS